jgi:cell division transport system ATP-binding protein
VCGKKKDINHSAFEENLMIKLNNISKVYPSGQAALRNITFTVRPGEFVFVTGPSGAGKTTLLRLIFGDEVHSKGNIEVLGLELNQFRRTIIPKLRQRLGVVFQDYKLLPRLSVQDNVGFPLEVLGVTKQSRLARVKEVLKEVCLEDKAQMFPETLSGGEQQRVAVARALINNPAIIVADEPTGNVDPEMARRIFELFISANDRGTAVVIASHNLELIEKLGKRTILLDKGRILDDVVIS